jgi:hypothetical protein
MRVTGHVEAVENQQGLAAQISVFAPKVFPFPHVAVPALVPARCAGATRALRTLALRAPTAITLGFSGGAAA